MPLRCLTLAVALVATSTLVPAGSLGGAAFASSGDGAIELRPGQPAFWEDRFERGSVPAPPGMSIARLHCDGLVVLCLDYDLDVADGGSRLRVALDQRYTGDAYELTLFGPDGSTHEAPWTRPDLSGYSLEALVDEPQPGAWLARVHLRAYDTGEFRMRAKLEETPTPIPPDQLMVPNLRPDAPFGPYFGVCLPDEVLAGADRCLRFSFAWGNAGDGTFELRYASDGTVDGAVVQRLYRTDGSYEDRPAGHASFHPTHAHWHYDGFVAVDLYRVVDPEAGVVADEPAVDGGKLGVCGHDWRMVDWHRFYQAPTGAADSPDECLLGALYSNGLSAGWADAYGSSQPGNYIDFGDNGDGEYVLRMTLDQDALLLESDETDNVGYTHILVEGDSVTVLERGLGTDPWDADRDVLPIDP